MIETKEFNSENTYLSTAKVTCPHPRSAWTIGQISCKKYLLDCEIRMISSGEVAQVLEITRNADASIIVQRITIYQALPRIDFSQRVQWNETGDADRDAPMLMLHFRPELKGTARASFSIPFGLHQKTPDGLAHACLHWVDLSDDEAGFTLVNNNKYGCTMNGNTISMHCIRSSYEPDPCPDVREHAFDFALYPHARACDAALANRQGRAFNSPIVITSGAQRAAFAAAVQVGGEGVAVSGLKPYGDNSCILRIYEIYGKSGEYHIRIKQKIRHAQELLLSEDGVIEPLPAKYNQLSGALKPFEIKTIHVEY